MIEINLISYITLIIGVCYILTALYLLSYAQPLKCAKPSSPSVSVLVAMRNEEEYIAGCLSSLEKQNYPSHLYNVYIIDDRSTDRSVDLVKPYLQRNPHFHLISIKEDLHGLKGKMNALAQAIDKVDIEIILITDADCVVPCSWISAYVSYFDKNVGMVGGLTLLEPAANIPIKNKKSSLFEKLQTLDWLFLQTIAAAASNADKPVSILGNNFGFRLQAYKDTGGFKSFGFSVTEDFVLMKAIEKTGKWKIKHTLDTENTIYSYPLKTIKEFYHQRKRWIIGGRSVRVWGYFITGLAFSAHAAMLLVFLTSQWNAIAGAGIGLIFAIDYFIINRGLKKLNLSYLKRYFFLFEIFYFLYTLLLGLFFFVPQKVIWKGRKF
jgi:cellulose synthase/poly-beta-1,6-N-acetylglucosamine synthase-like glycosyltransferase